MDYKLIGDVGATKASWILSDERGEVIVDITTDGVNALTADPAVLSVMAKTLKENVGEERVPLEIFYYGAGCATPEICDKVSASFSPVFPGSQINVYSDMLGAARSLLGNEAGIVCILGTGSNSCRYDGNKIKDNVPSLGYILGDEGSGAALGKRLVADAFKGKLPSPIRDRFLERYNMSLGEILDKVYRQGAPNKFLASLVPFISEHLWNPYIYAMVRREFDTFLNRNVSSYADSRSVPISFTGSIAFHFYEILREAVDEAGYKVGKITSHPIAGLVEYHTLYKKSEK